MAQNPHVVIIGGGFGGLSAARALKRATVQVTLLDRRNHHLFQPLLYQVATAGLSPGDIAYPIRSILRRQKNARVLLEEVHSIDVERRELILSDTRLGYDFLIVAAGARHSYFGHDSWEDDAPGLKTLEDALEIRRRILLAFEMAEREIDEHRREELLTFVVVGAGPTGVEMAGAIAEISRYVLSSDFRNIDPRRARIILIEAGPRILPTFPEALAAKAEGMLRKLGVEVRLGAAVTAVDATAVTLKNETVRSRTTLWAAGNAASPMLKSIGATLDRAGRVLIRPDLTIEGHPEVFVIGDAAALVGTDGKMLPALAPVAIQQGRHAARNIMNSSAGHPYLDFHYKDRGSMTAIGRSRAIADFGKIRVSGLVAWILWVFVHIYMLIGFRSRTIVMFEWAVAYFTDRRGARLITGDLERRRRRSSSKSKAL
jgi:NADH dehydrogenase